MLMEVGGGGEQLEYPDCGCNADVFSESEMHTYTGLSRYVGCSVTIPSAVHSLLDGISLFSEPPLGRLFCSC